MSELWASRFGFATGPWHRWFAWHPVYTQDRGWTWLRLVERQRYHLKAHLDEGRGPSAWWFYRRAP